MTAEARYTGSDGQRHAATILATHPDGCETIRRGYYDPLDGTTVRWHAVDLPIHYGPPAPVRPCPRHQERQP